MPSNSKSWRIVTASIVVLLLSQSAFALLQDAAHDMTPSNSAPPLTSQDSAELRRQSNLQFAGATFRGRVTQRFEMYNPHSEAALRDLKSMGFTQVILDWPNLHDAAARAGLKVVLANWWTQDTKSEDIEKGIEQAREVNPESLIGFCVMDEPERNAPETPFGFYIDLYEKLKPTFSEEFPSTRIEISHWGPMASWSDAHYDYFSFLYEAADVMRIMPYPDLYEAPLDDVYYMIQRSRKLMKTANRELPLVVILQTWILPPKNQLPAIAELRVMALQAMLSGAETVSFFDFNTEVWNKTPGFSDQFRTLMKELTELSQRYRDHLVETTMTADGILKSKLTSSTGSTIRIEINSQRQAVAGFEALEVKFGAESCPAWIVVDSVNCVPSIVQQNCCTVSASDSARVAICRNRSSVDSYRWNVRQIHRDHCGRSFSQRHTVRQPRRLRSSVISSVSDRF